MHQLEHESATRQAATARTAAQYRAIKVPAGIHEQPAVRIDPVRSTLEVVENCVRPATASGRGQFINRPAILCAAFTSRSVDVAGRIEGQSVSWKGAVALPREVEKGIVRPASI